MEQRNSQFFKRLLIHEKAILSRQSKNLSLTILGLGGATFGLGITGIFYKISGIAAMIGILIMILAFFSISYSLKEYKRNNRVLHKIRKKTRIYQKICQSI